MCETNVINLTDHYIHGYTAFTYSDTMDVLVWANFSILQHHKGLVAVVGQCSHNGKLNSRTPQRNHKGVELSKTSTSIHFNGDFIDLYRSFGLDLMS